MFSLYSYVLHNEIMENKNMVDIQYINDSQGKPAFAVIPIADFVAMGTSAAPSLEERSSLLSEDGLSISLPHGGGAVIDLRQFIYAWIRRGTVSMSMPVNKRRQRYDEFSHETINTLDPVLRRCFLPADSPYRNTMQATTAVVDALVETGVFELVTNSHPGFYRPVQCLRIDEVAANEFIKEHGKPTLALDPHVFCLP